MIQNGVLIGLAPEIIRDMTPKDTWSVFQGWQDANAPDDENSEAMTSEQYRNLVEHIDGN